MARSIKEIPRKLIMDNSVIGEVKYLLVSLVPGSKGKINGIGVVSKKGTLPFKNIDGIYVVPTTMFSISERGYTINNAAYKVMMSRMSRYKKQD
ncbi:MAG: hypothetical protein QXL15_03990 [Candidatus Korarchaeota archaeon]